LSLKSGELHIHSAVILIKLVSVQLVLAHFIYAFLDEIKSLVNVFFVDNILSESIVCLFKLCCDQFNRHRAFGYLLAELLRLHLELGIVLINLRYDDLSILTQLLHSLVQFSVYIVNARLLSNKLRSNQHNVTFHRID
jgi:esterase/lipase superfamily enzyme